MNKADKYFKDNLDRIQFEGHSDSMEKIRPKWSDNLPAGSRYILNVHEEYNIHEGEYPIQTLRKIPVKLATNEMRWIWLEGSNSIARATELGIGNWWKDFDIGNGTVGHRYGYTNRKNNMFHLLLQSLIDNPFDRGHILNLWQIDDLNSSKGLRPCAYMANFSCWRGENNKVMVDLHLTLRSSDYLMAGHINRIQYTFLLMFICSALGYHPGKLSVHTVNMHVYLRHFEALNYLLNKDPLDIQPSIELDADFDSLKSAKYLVKEINTQDIKPLPFKLELAI